MSFYVAITDPSAALLTKNISHGKGVRIFYFDTSEDVGTVSLNSRKS